MEKKKKDPKQVKLGKLRRNKGGVGEREFAREINLLFDLGAHRTAQRRGSAKSGDIDCEAPVQWEVKRKESISLYPAVEQAVKDSEGVKIPALAHRRNNRPWLVVVRLEDLPEFIRVMGPFIREKENEDVI